MPWEPGAGIGTPNANLTLFNSQGVALPSIGIFRNPAAVCQSYDLWDVPCVVGGYAPAARRAGLSVRAGQERGAGR